MIKIITSEFEIIQTAHNLYDLKLPVIINAGKSNERKEMKVYYNTVTFDTAIKTIISKKLSDKKQTVSLEEFVKLYSEEVNTVCKIIRENLVNES